MPGRDGTGPMSQGPLTGRGMGWCQEGDAPRYARPLRGLGLRRGWGRMAPQNFGYEQDLGMLENMVIELQEKVDRLTQKTDE